MIVRVKILRKGGSIVVRDWVLLKKMLKHGYLKGLSHSLLDGSYNNEFFPPIEPFYLLCRLTIARCGMRLDDLMATPSESMLTITSSFDC